MVPASGQQTSQVKFPYLQTRKSDNILWICDEHSKKHMYSDILRVEAKHSIVIVTVIPFIIAVKGASVEICLF